MDWFQENPQEIMGCSYHISTAIRELVITLFEKSQEATLRFYSRSLILFLGGFCVASLFFRHIGKAQDPREKCKQRACDFLQNCELYFSKYPSFTESQKVRIEICVLQLALRYFEMNHFEPYQCVHS